MRRTSASEFLVDGATNLVECLSVTRKARHQFGLLTTGHTPNRLTTLEAAQQRAMTHALVAFARAVDAVEHLRVGTRRSVGLAHTAAAAELGFRQHVLTGNAGSWLGVREARPVARQTACKRVAVDADKSDDRSCSKEEVSPCDHGIKHNNGRLAGQPFPARSASGFREVLMKPGFERAARSSGPALARSRRIGARKARQQSRQHVTRGAQSRGEEGRRDTEAARARLDGVPTIPLGEVGRLRDVRVDPRVAGSYVSSVSERGQTSGMEIDFA